MINEPGDWLSCVVRICKDACNNADVCSGPCQKAQSFCRAPLYLSSATTVPFSLYICVYVSLSLSLSSPSPSFSRSWLLLVVEVGEKLVAKAMASQASIEHLVFSLVPAVGGFVSFGSMRAQTFRDYFPSIKHRPVVEQTQAQNLSTLKYTHCKEQKLSECPREKKSLH